MRIVWQVWTVVFLSTVFLLFFFTASLESHELTHWKIFKIYNIDSSIVYGIPFSYTIPTIDYNDTYQVERMLQTRPYHAMTEIITYEITMNFLIAIFSSGIIAMSIILSRGGKNA
jgi:hypothetical protein